MRGAVAEAVRELQAFPTVQQALQQYRDGEVARDTQDVRVLSATLRRQRMRAAAVRDQRLPTAK